MIDEQRTLEIYGYTSDELKPKSRKPIVAVCECCGRYRDLSKFNYRELCNSCARKKRYKDLEERQKTSESAKKCWSDIELRKKASESAIKRWSDLEERKKLSVTKQCIPYEEWIGFATEQKYCRKFDKYIRQYIRDKYNNCDYISGIAACICNGNRKLSVHHVDYNKQQGCDTHEWRLIPLSGVNHTMTNANRPFWNRLFTYSLQYDETYYNTEHINIKDMI